MINAGSVLQDLGLEVLGGGRPTLEQNLETIGSTLRRIYERADADGISAEEAAEQLVASRLRAP